MSDGMKITRSELNKYKNMYQSARSKAAKVMEKGDSIVRTVITTAEVQTTAFTMGVVDGKTGGIQVIGCPLGLGLGLITHGAGFAGLGGESSHHLHGFGDGFLASFFNTLGRGVGLKWAKDATEEKKPVAGQLPGGQKAQPVTGMPGPDVAAAGQWLSDEQMAAIMRNARRAA